MPESVGGTTVNPGDLKLRGYAERESDGSWFIICVDLNLYARADSLSEARSKLHEFMVDYLREAFEQDREYFDQLVPRPAPLHFRLKYRWLVFLSQLRGLKDHGRNGRDDLSRPGPFSEAMPLQVAC